MNRNRDKKGNITSAFGSDIILEGMTSVPNLLLKYYSKIGITDNEMMLVIQLMYLQTSTDQQFPSFETLAGFMSADSAHIKADLASLIEKGIISINHIYSKNTDDIVAIYSYEPLFEKIMELWACEKIEACQQMKKTLKVQKQASGSLKPGEKRAAFAHVCQSFEKEFGRLLSPMEIEQVNQWLDEDRPELIMEALKRAVMLGKHNFKYIDSILLEWHKNNLKTTGDVLQHEANFRQRQVNRPAKQKSQITAKKPDKFRMLYLG